MSTRVCRSSHGIRCIRHTRWAYRPACSPSIRSIAATTLLVVAAGAVANALGQSAVVSPTTAETSGLNTALRSLPRQYMEYFDNSQLSAISQSSLIVGVRFRLAAFAQTGASPALTPPGSWPNAPLNWASYVVQLSKPSAVVTGAVGGAQFPSFQPWGNYQDAATVTTVYNGPLTINANTFPFTSDTLANGPNAFATAVMFTTPYVYTPGDGMVMYIRHPGSGDANNAFMASADFAPEVSDAVSAPDDVAAAPTGFSSPIICEFIVKSRGRLIAVDSGRALSEIDQLTGAKTAIGTVSSNASTTAGLAFDRTTRIMYVTSTGNDSLFSLHLGTGNATLIGPYGDPAIVMHGLEHDDSTGTLYGVSSHNNGLYSISKTTGAATLIGTSGLTSFSNLGYNSATNVMYSTNSGTDSFYTMDRATGATTLIGPLTGPTNPNGLAFNSDNGLLYMVDNNTDTLYTINTATGAAQPLGVMGTGNILGLAYIPFALSCYVNCDASTGTPILTANDFQCFLDKFASSAAYANCDGSTGVPALTANDFQCFLNAFAAGCS